jgi:hypothetical protein
VKFCVKEPYQFVPSDTKLRMSMRPAVDVTVGAVPPDHLTPVNVAVPAPVVVACLSRRMKDLPAVAVGIVNVHAVEAVSVAVCTVPEVNAMVFVDVTVPIATTDSV